jgi:hypothetical protein
MQYKTKFPDFLPVGKYIYSKYLRISPLLFQEFKQIKPEIIRSLNKLKPSAPPSLFPTNKYRKQITKNSLEFLFVYCEKFLGSKLLNSSYLLMYNIHTGTVA